MFSRKAAKPQSRKETRLFVFLLAPFAGSFELVEEFH
jgi:hypothetical protein